MATVSGRTQAINAVRYSNVTVAVLDMVCAGMSGLEFRKHVREEGKTVLVLMPAAGDAIEDRVYRLDSNAAGMLAHTSILEAARDSRQNIRRNLISQCLSALGKKLEASGCSRHVVTLRGLGYPLATPTANPAIL